MREIRPNVWVDYFISTTSRIDNIVVTDVRFPNEFEGVRKAGGLLVRLEVPEAIRVSRYIALYGAEPTEEQMYHESEVALDEQHGWDFIIQNGGELSKLLMQIDAMMKTLYGYSSLSHAVN